MTALSITELFCDTSYFVALLDPHDDLHKVAETLSSMYSNTPMCTTTSVLIETLNYFSRYPTEIRSAAADLITVVAQHEQFAIIHLTHDLMHSSIAFYRERKDKSYSNPTLAPIVFRCS